MANIQLKSDYPHNYISVPHVFIDQYMADANGEFVKVYLFLLRCMASASDCSISAIADYFDSTEKDILRALKYWEKAGVLRTEVNSENELTSLCFKNLTDCTENKLQESTKTPVSVPDAADSSMAAAGSMESSIGESSVRTSSMGISSMGASSMGASSMGASSMGASSTTAPSMTEIPSAAEPKPVRIKKALPSKKREYTLDEVSAFYSNDEVTELLFIIETYLKHPLNSTEMNTVFYWYDGLKFSGEIIEYLVEYCITNGHSSLRYMDKVALGWAENGIDSIEKAKEHVSIRSKAYYSIMKAFGISGRNLAESEVTFVTKWTREYCFDIELIQEACKRTISSTQKPSFEYADRILTNWYKNHVHTLKDIASLDEAFNKNKQLNAASQKASTVKRNTFNNFHQRTYDGDEYEKMLLTTTVQ